jgi:sigma-B regulation protein RsbU (phosphoserine phosphatase)
MNEPNLPGNAKDLDLALAAELQAALLPVRCPSDCAHHRAAAANRMSSEIGGDFYDFLRLNDDHVALIIGDVIGHGVRASLIMAKIMGFLRSLPASAGRPSKLVSELNRILIDLGERVGRPLLCTFFYALLDLPSGNAFTVNAGHPSPFICGTESCRILTLGVRNMALGVQPVEYKEACHEFQPGERMVLFTDGLTEAMNAEEENFGLQRLHEVVNGFAGAAPQQCVDGVMAAVDDWQQGRPPRDDQTVVAIDRV